MAQIKGMAILGTLKFVKETAGKERIAELMPFLSPAARAPPSAATIVAPGTSCRHQIHDGTGRRALHPVEVLAATAPAPPPI